MARSTRLLAVPLLALCVLPGPAAAGKETPAPPRPALVLVTLASLRSDRLSPSGHGRECAPHLVRLGSRGVLLDQARTPSPATLPALASLLTGRAPARHGLYPGGRPPQDLEPLPGRLAAAGYSLAVYGNLEVDGSALKRLGLADAKTDIEPRLDAQGVVDRALAAESSALGGGSRMVWIHLQDLAAPYVPPLGDLLEFRGDGRNSIWEFPLALSSDDGRPNTLPARAANGPLRQAAFYMDSYDAAVRDVDRALGRLAESWLPVLQSSGGLLVVASLHGEALGEHGQWFSHGGTLYEEELRVPLLLLGGELQAHAARTAAAPPVSLLDVTPTLLGLLGLRPQPGVIEDGFNLAPFLRGSGAAPMRFLTAGLAVPPYSRSVLAEGRMKLIMTPPRPPMIAPVEGWPEQGLRELYDLELDPVESRDQSRERGSISHDMAVWLELSAPPWPGTPPAEDSSRRR